MADWIASNTNFFPLIPVTQVTDYSEYYPDRVEKAWNDLHLEKPWESESCPFSDEEFNTIFGFSPNDIQKAMMKMASNVDNLGLIICEAPMGIGKTEAALAAAMILNAKEKEGGLFFGLPTQATANGIFTRIEKWGETVNFHSKCKILGRVAEFFSKAFLCRFPPENFPRPVVYPVHSLPV